MVSDVSALSLWVEDAAWVTQAKLYAAKLGCRLVRADPGQQTRVLTYGPKGLSLRGPTQSGVATLTMTYHQGTLARRLYQMGQGDSLLKRALRGKGKMPVRVMDATAGLCRDALAMAMMGCHVDAYERSLLVVALVSDGLQRASADGKFQTRIQDRFTLNHDDAREEMQRCQDESAPPDLVYLDPMFPARTKSAQVTKEMGLLHHFLEPLEEGSSLVRAALQTGANRVIVKRPRRAQPLCPGAVHQFEGKSTRFDLYVP